MPRLRVTVGGPLGTASDWSNTYEFLLSSAIPSQSVLQTIATAIQTNLAASSAYKVGICSDTQTVNIKLLHYPSNTGVSNLVAVGSGTAFAGTASPVHAPQVCVVASLRSAIAGRSSRGRVYVPYRASNISALGVVNSAAQGLVAGHVSAVVSAVGTAVAAQSISASWIVWSVKNGTGVPVTSILVGTQCDTIRHRNRNRSEAYLSFTPPSISVTVPDEASAEPFNIAGAHFVGPSGLDPQIDQAVGIVLGAVVGDGG